MTKTRDCFQSLRTLNQRLDGQIQRGQKSLEEVNAFLKTRSQSSTKKGSKTMTLQEMADRLCEEFPGQYVCFSMEVHKYSDERREIEVTLYGANLSKHVDAENFEDAVRKLHLALNDGKVTPNEIIEEVA